MSSVLLERPARPREKTFRVSTDSNASTSAASVVDHTDLEVGQQDNGPLPLQELLQKGFTHRELEQLREGGFQTVECVAFAPDRVVQNVKGISEVKCDKLKAACKELVGMGFCSATEFLEARQNLIRFTTGSVDLDRVLMGGIETGSITEVAGEYRTGKTQLCHTLAVTCQLPVDASGGEGRCLWIDTEGTFRPERIVSIAARYELNAQSVLDNIVYARAYNTDHLLNLVVEAAALMSRSRFALMVIDSIIALYRNEFGGRGELAARQMHLGRTLRVIQRIADTFGVAVVLSNQVMAKVDGMPGQDKVPTGGHVLAHTCQTRLFLRKGKGEARICKIIDSPSLPESEAQFVIKEGGISTGPS